MTLLTTTTLNKKSYTEIITKNKELIILSSLSFIIPVLLILFSTQQSARKLSMAIPFLIVILSCIILHNGKHIKIRSLLVTLILITQFICLNIYHFSNKNNSNKYHKISGDIPKIKKTNYNLEIFEYLKTVQPKYNFNVTNILFTAGEFDVFVVNGLTSTSLNKQNFMTTFTYLPVFKEDQYLEPKRRNHDTFFIQNPFKETERSEAYYEKLQYYKNCTDYKKCSLGFMGFASGKLIADMLIRIYDNKLKQSGFELLETKTMGGYEFYLLKVI